MKPDPIKLMHDRRMFGKFFRDVRTWAAWEVFLKAVFTLSMTAGERELFTRSTGLDGPPKQRPSQVYVIAGRRSGKSVMAALIALYLALFEDWKGKVSPGERPVVLLMASDKSQAAIVKRYIEGFLDLTPTLRAAVKRVKAEEIELENGVVILIKPCSFRAIRGLTVAAAVLEELSFWRFESESASPDREVVTALKPALSTTSGLIFGISTPYTRAGFLYEQFKASWGKPGSTLIWKAATAIMNPTIDKGIIDRAIEEDQAAAAAEWLGEFRLDLTGYVDPEIVDAAVIPGRVMQPPVAGLRYVAFLDPSGGRQDSFGMALAHFDSVKRKGILDLVAERRPPFDPSEVVSEFAEVLKSYRIERAKADSYAGEWVSAAFRAHGIELMASDKSKSELYLECLPRFNSGVIELLDQRRLVAQLKALERKTRAGGRDQVDTFYPGGHDDISNSACGALVSAFDVSSTRPGRVFAHGQLIAGPPDPPGMPTRRRVFFCQPSARTVDRDELIRESLRRGRMAPPDDD
jgi:hypothetical protein